MNKSGMKVVHKDLNNAGKKVYNCDGCLRSFIWRDGCVSVTKGVFEEGVAYDIEKIYCTECLPLLNDNNEIEK